MFTEVLTGFTPCYGSKYTYALFSSPKAVLLSTIDHQPSTFLEPYGSVRLLTAFEHGESSMFTDVLTGFTACYGSKCTSALFSSPKAVLLSTIDHPLAGAPVLSTSFHLFPAFST